MGEHIITPEKNSQVALRSWIPQQKFCSLWPAGSSWLYHFRRKLKQITLSGNLNPNPIIVSSCSMQDHQAC